MVSSFLKKRVKEIRDDPGRCECGILAIAELSQPASHELIQLALQGLANMEHRGGTLDDTGDGAGILIKPERSFFEQFVTPGRHIPTAKEPLIVGTIFFLHGERNIPHLQREIDLLLRREGLSPLGWRETPVDMEALGRRAREDAPHSYQLLVAKGHRRESQLFTALHEIKVALEKQMNGLVYVVSLAPYTTVYKALATADQLMKYYLDFHDPSFTSSAAIAHRRFSTNTFSSWNLVQPFRQIAHNGEINTIKANCRAIRDADCALKMTDTLMNHGSDSAQVDRVAEMMAATGMEGIHEALRRMMPPAWSDGRIDENERQFFEANRRTMGTLGAWEGPIAIVGTDGRRLVAILDRMGLRPLRYLSTTAGRIIVSSEVGAVPVDPRTIDRDGQLEPGDLLIADLVTGTLIPPESSTRWIIDRTGMNFKHLSTVDLLPLGFGKLQESLATGVLNSFGWTRERVRHLHQTIRGAKEPICGMGNDRPLAIFSENRSRLYSYMHQIVAVVTNPPIDPIREGSAIDTTVYLGRSPRLTRKSDYKSWPQYKLAHPVLTNEDMDALLTSDAANLRAHVLDATFEDKGKSRTMVRRIHELSNEALSAIRTGRASILVVSDYRATKEARLPLPILLVVNAIHRELAARGLRRDASIVVESGEIHEAHDCATLMAYGATAINPYIMFDLARNISDMDPYESKEHLVTSIVHTLRRVMSKMGITTIAGYRGSALFEAIGLSSDLVEYFIPDTVSRLGGITIDDIYADIVARFSQRSEELARNMNTSVYRKDVTDALQRVARNGNAQGDYDRFVSLLEDTPPIYLRDMLEWTHRAASIDIDRVAGSREIIRSTVCGAAMSHGALNATAHRAIAAAFNHFGARANSGEGGEDPRRNRGNEWETDRSRTRQIASGRFGVDAAYLVHADEIEIKIGQGAKPGEGGHLPGHKVTAEIACIRKTKAGVDLISPPPHHDIYSIEDLAQLIRNLRELHPTATIAVKVPSITGLGTIAVGIAKAGADIIAISCYSGGTGAASWGSITHAGLPLERGVSEVHQYLVANGVREKMRIRADGGIKTGLDAAKIMALGADEIAIGTPLLIAERCVFCRGCNKGNCPAGITTHDEEKNERFMRPYISDDSMGEVASSERYEEAKRGVINYLECFATHLRAILAECGITHPRELVGRTDLLSQQITENVRWNTLDLAELLFDIRARTKGKPDTSSASLFRISAKNAALLEGARSVLEGRTARAALTVEPLANADHAIGATLAGEIARRGCTLENNAITVEATGFAGQGFGFAATSGMTLKLAGYANDAVAEIMSGTARVIIAAPVERVKGSTPHLIGNAAAYGATGGTLFVAGRAGQRFGVRNSGAVLVCEGVGKYAFEYMTGGTGLALGPCGPVIGSGLTGGELFLHDPDGASQSYLHEDVIAAKIVSGSKQEQTLNNILGDFFETTKSPRAATMLENWQETLAEFIHVMPR